MHLKIPCEVFARLANAHKFAPDDLGAWFRSIRYEDGILVATNRLMLAAEYVGGPSGTLHISIEKPLVDQCRIEGALGSTLEINYVEQLAFASAKTTLGYNFPGNAIVAPSGVNEFDKWRTVFDAAPLTASRRPMLWTTDRLRFLFETSPSGSIVFPEFIDGHEPVILRDAIDTKWAGAFIPTDKAVHSFSAVKPDWLA